MLHFTDVFCLGGNGMRMFLRLKLMLLAFAIGGTLCAVPAAIADEQFIPLLVYRSGPYAPNGIPFANGFVDYLNLVNARDGGVNGVTITFEECETGYATDRGVECYERLKGKGPTGASVMNPLSTGITFALTEKAYTDKIPIITMGYGRSESVNGSVFPWNFPLLGTYWTAADILVQHVGNLNGGLANLKGKKIALIYHDSPYGKEPIPLLEKRAKMHGFKLLKIPVTHPGVEQKSAWLQVRQNRPDYVFLWGWGIMNSTAIREAASVRYPRDQIYGVWWAGAEPDVMPAGKNAKGYNSITLQHSSGQTAVHADALEYLYAKGNGAGDKENVGDVLYNRGLINAVLSIEAIRTAQGKYGNKSLTGEQVRWGIENLDIDTKRIKALGLEGMMQPLKVSCNDHEGVRRARIHQWTGSEWVFVSDWIEADNSLLRPMVDKAAAAYAKEKGITPIACKA
jgi:branched-chain amino acid transport system substrate-binding protein